MIKKIQRDTLFGAKEIIRLLEIEVDGVRWTLVDKEEEAKHLQDAQDEM